MSACQCSTQVIYMCNVSLATDCILLVLIYTIAGHVPLRVDKLWM